MENQMKWEAIFLPLNDNQNDKKNDHNLTKEKMK